MTESTRHVASHHDEDGVRFAEVTASPTSNQIRSEVTADPPNVIPIILLPGIMGSNLQASEQVELDGRILAAAGDPVWRVDSAVGVALSWLGKNAAERSRLLNKEVLEIDRRGKIKLGRKETGDKEALIADKRRRGWGTVSWGFYGKTLQWLEDAFGSLGVESAVEPSEGAVSGVPNEGLRTLLDTVVDQAVESARTQPEALTEGDVATLLDARFPIHAFGYNWTESNSESGEKAAAYIEEIVERYNNSGDDGGTSSTCRGVILLTHSMGGLVARSAAMEHGADAKILGILHGVMPTHGAGAFYKRMVAGFSNEHTSFFDIVGRVTAYALGKTARETLPVLAFNPGPLELAPNHRYNDGKPWLHIRSADGTIVKSLPESVGGAPADPYDQIYARTDVWWRAVNPEWLDPVGLALDPEGGFLDVLDQAERYHRTLADAAGFHPTTYAHYGADAGHSAWGDVVWEVTPSRRNLWGAGWRVTDGGSSREGLPETWTIHRHDADERAILRDATGAEITAQIQKGTDPGDGTVPAAASAASVDRFSQVACAYENAFDHNADYLDERVKAWVCNVVVRLVNA